MEQTHEMDTGTPAAPPKKGLPLAIGIIELIFGAIAVCVTLFIAASMNLIKSASQEVDSGQILLAVLVYGCIAAFFVLMGIGTLRMKRWARSIMIVASWITLAAGVTTLLILFTGLSKFIGLQVPIEYRSFSRVIFAVMGLFIALILIVVPALFILLYSLKSSQKAFGYYDRKTHWTDRVSLPELSFVLILWSSAFSSIVGCIGGIPFPFFGIFISSWAARILWFAFAAALVYVGYMSYIRDRLGWIFGFVLLVLMLLTTWLSFAISGIENFYALYYPEVKSVIENFSQMDRLFTRMFIYILVIYFGYFAYMARIFRGISKD